MVVLSQNYLLQDHLTVSSHAIITLPTLHDSMTALCMCLINAVATFHLNHTSLVLSADSRRVSLQNCQIWSQQNYKNVRHTAKASTFNNLDISTVCNKAILRKLLCRRPADGFLLCLCYLFNWILRFHFHLVSREFPTVRVQPIAVVRGMRQTDGETPCLIS